MPRGHHSGDIPESPADLIRRLTAEISGGPPSAVDPADLAASESRRRLRRPDLVRYRVRVDLSGAKPPLWRRLELASGLFLEEVHEILQVAFGWTDSHLHQFGSADGTPLGTLDADRAAWDTRNVLRRLGGLTEDPRHYGAGSPNTDGAAFARAAVSTWPDADKPP